jgi:hypothetical protein
VHAMLIQVLLAVIAGIFFFSGILVLFMVNSRINLKRKIQQRQRVLRIMNVAQNMENTEKAAEEVGMKLEDFVEFCKRMSIELPEARIARQENLRLKKEEELNRIMAEEAAWRAEQEKLNEENRAEKEQEAKKRRDRLRKFGIS